MDQVTAELVIPVTVAANCWLAPTAMAAAAGDIVMLGPGGVEVADGEPPPPQALRVNPAAKIVTRDTTVTLTPFTGYITPSKMRRGAG